jgi:phage protein D/phage baseplate assembly protein gpV
MPAQQHVASASIKVKGTPLDPSLMDKVEKIEVRNFRGLPDMATIRLGDPEGKYVVAPPFFIGDEIEVLLGSLEANRPEKVFTGEILTYEPEFTAAAATICVRAYDASHRMHRNRRSATYQQMTVGDIVKKVAGENALRTGEVEMGGTVHPFLQQSMETDLDFLSRLAATENCEVGVTDGKVFMERVGSANGPVPTLNWRKNVVSFKPRMSASQQPATVKVQSYDPGTKKAITGEATAPAPDALSKVGKEIRGIADQIFGAAELLVADRIVNTAEEAKKLAQSTMDKLALGSFEAEGVMKGDPHMKAGGKIKLEGFGKFDGEHYVTSVTHVYGHGDFRSRFAISGRNPRTLTDVMRPKNEREWTAGLVIGLVTNINDPEKLGRVRVKFAALGDEIEGNWARIALAGAGKDAGMAFLPMVGDEVVVGFEHGDTRRPVVLGSLHNSVDPPHEKMAGNKDGGSLVVYGRQDAEINTKKQFVIDAKDNMTITIDRGDDGPGEYKLDAKDQIEVKAGTKIFIEGTGEVTIKSSAGINVQAAGPLKLEGATVDIQATGTVNVKGSLINLG